jgi:hypothetical protein
MPAIWSNDTAMIFCRVIIKPSNPSDVAAIKTAASWCWNAMVASIRFVSPIPVGTAAVPTASITKASDGWNDKRQNCSMSTIL